jgi:hypothetical protein
MLSIIFVIQALIYQYACILSVGEVSYHYQTNYPNKYRMKNHLSIRKVWLSLSFILGITLLATAQTSTKATSTSGTSAGKSSALLGAWQGTFGGSASGKCELRLAREGSGNPTGQISILPDGGEQSPFITFESVVLEGSHLKATFTDSQGEKVQMDGTLENEGLKGSWKTSAGQEGNWQTTKVAKE